LLDNIILSVNILDKLLILLMINNNT